MSYWLEWYIAKESEAETVAATLTHDRAPQWPEFAIKNIGIYELMWLRSIMHGTDFDVDPDLSPAGRLLYEAEDKGMGVFRVKDEFVEELARIKYDEIDKLAEAWVQTEPMIGFGWHASELAEIIRELADFAAQSKSLNTPILGLYVI